MLLIVLWVRSYFEIDFVDWWLSKKAISLTSYHGQLGMIWMNFKSALAAESQSFSYHILPISEGRHVAYKDGTGQPLPSYLGFQSSLLSASARWQVFNIVVPYWFPTLISGLGAVVPWRTRWSTRFTLPHSTHRHDARGRRARADRVGGSSITHPSWRAFSYAVE